MRLNKYIAHASGISRRQADRLIESGRVSVDGRVAELGERVDGDCRVTIDNEPVRMREYISIMLNKPPGYVSSRAQQGDAPTIYELLPERLHELKPIGRLDKMSRGLLLLTNDGDLAYKLTHPKNRKRKTYYVKLHTALEPADLEQIQSGVELSDGVSRLQVQSQDDLVNIYKVTMREGRNRQIRRTFSSLDYEVLDLFRSEFGDYQLGDLAEGEWKSVTTD